MTVKQGFGTYGPDYGKPPAGLATAVCAALKNNPQSIAYRLGFQAFMAGKPSAGSGGNFGYNEHSFDWMNGWLDGRDGSYGKRPSNSKADCKRLANLFLEFKGR